ncbi:RNA polymerase sigma-70 factor, ECF subfamily [Catalinimonas alkaloidigena]|uniref:RNA polymerase sigma-70 factor, ECF subfamily n=2 Tax=Catalinimonas alkaloidigena TaxID=1075417 RepID=A0A1G9AAE8_9BACT|nr:RNA polymerase sigma-70 factor, ECF subfamily [Catalinimonas alkaloidigena]
MLYQHFYSYAMSICMRYAPNREDALEILNDGFMKIFTKIDKRYDTSRSFAGWLRRIMINTALDYYRKQARQPHEEELQQAAAVSLDGDQLAQLQYEELVDMVQKLTPAYRTVFNLYAIDGFNHEEIAAMLHISVGTSKSNLAKARVKLQHMLEKHYNHERIRST